MDGMSVANEVTNEWSMTSCLLGLSGGVLAGMAVGYALKAACKMALLMVGSFILIMLMLANAGFITVNWDVVSMGLETGSKAAGAWAMDAVTQLSSSFAGFAGGIALGWKFR